jgi:hypothetical protein
MVSVCPVLDCILGNSHGAAASWFWSYEWSSDPSLANICQFIAINALMTWNPYQLYSVMFSQLYQGLVQYQTSFEVIQWLQELYSHLG